MTYEQAEDLAYEATMEYAMELVSPNSLEFCEMIEGDWWDTNYEINFNRVWNEG